MMRRGGVRAAIAAGMFLFGASAVWSAAGPAPLPPPDPTAKNLSPYMIKLRAFDACLVTQSRLQGTTREAVHSACSCYASGTVDSMSKAELAAFRQTGYFNDSAREKGLKFVEKCKLKRPD